ncbi:MAG: hypothetical protein QT02_C0006G0006 [archaeon GW2011_AR9]|nr:MAG: hypothetical protein QT02_C0006G0006 [archaeon GW2011_AR9]MBS3120477.1 hypothetical protein [Candidatus Woesearchaeota archaeon]HIG92649.1 hypothetical protein [Candidatus Woesearchaeota archaeon]HIH12288.1 hypothetical protein [Candidatus Woesearchaeota archaeon]
MVWKMSSPFDSGGGSERPLGGGYRSPASYATPVATSVPRPKARQPGNLIAQVGKTTKSKVSKDRTSESLERLLRIDDDLLGYNLEGGRVLLRCPQNERAFDTYIALPFVKGVTERESGRTLLILGSNAHHGEAMENQFEGVVRPEREEDKLYGNCVRWINVGDTKDGFIGLDYQPEAKATDGVALNLQDIQFLAKMLLEYGYDGNKKLFLLHPPYIREQDEGKKLRGDGWRTLQDYAKKELPKEGK